MQNEKNEVEDLTALKMERRRTVERDKVKRECSSVPLPVTRQVARAFSTGVDWGSSSKGLIFESMATTGPQGFSRNWEGFKAAMSETAAIIKRHDRSVYEEVENAIKMVKRRRAEAG